MPAGAARQGERTSRLPPTVVKLGVVSLFNDMASEMIYPLLPAFVAATLAGGALAVGWIEGVAEATAALVKLQSGRASDRRRARKPLVGAGYALANAARPLIGLARTWPVVLVLRFADRIGKGLRTAPRDAWIAAAVPDNMRGRAFGFHRSLDHLGALVGPLLASALLLGGLDVRGVFLASVVPGVITVAVVLLTGEPKPSPDAEPPKPRDTTATVTTPTRHYRRVLAAIFLFTLGNATDAFLLLKLTIAGLKLAWLPLAWAALHAVKSFATSRVGHVADRIEPERLIRWGWLWYAAVYAGLAVAVSLPATLSLFLAYGVFYGLTEPPERVLIARYAPDRKLGSGFGWYHAAVGLAALPSSAGFGWLWTTYCPAAAFVAGAVLALASALVLPAPPQQAGA